MILSLRTNIRMKKEDMNLERVEIDIKEDTMMMIEIIEDIMIEMEEDSEAEVIKMQDIIKKRVIHFTSAICLTIQQKN